MNIKSKKALLYIGMVLMTFSEISQAMDIHHEPIAYDDQGFLPLVDAQCFEALDIRIGEVTTAEINQKARVPSLRLIMDFSSGFDDLKQSSAQLRDNYSAEGENDSGLEKAPLLGKQVAAVTNFPRRLVGIPSYFLTVGVVALKGEKTGTVVVVPLAKVPNGIKVKLLNDDKGSDGTPRLEQTNYVETFAKLDIRVGTVTSIEEKTIDFGDKLGSFTFSGDYSYLKNGDQILRVINLRGLELKDNILGVINDSGERIPVTLERRMPNGRFLK